jgi:two-component system nitrate/nitrite response regulator NarL
MSLRIATAIIEPNMLMREGLTSLLEKYSYRVVGSANDAVDLTARTLPEPPRLVLVGAKTIDQALAGASASRKLWPDAKIILLRGPRNADDFRQMQESEIDGSVPLSVSQDTLMRAVDLVMLENAKILVTVGLPHSAVRPPAHEMEPLEQARERRTGNGDDSNGSVLLAPASPTLAYVNDTKNLADRTQNQPRPRNYPQLSEREAQVLEGIVCGYSNKLIARKRGITEATVKVHMKSILRKIQVANRTQAAVWAMENSYLSHVEKRLLEAGETDSTGNAAA